MPGPIPAFQLLSVLMDALLTDVGERLVETFARAADLLPQELPRRAEFGPGDESEVSAAVRSAVERAGLSAVRDALVREFERTITRFTESPDFDVPGATLDKLAQMVTSTTRRVTELGQRTDADVQRVLALAVRQPLTGVELADQLRAALGAEGRYARTLVETEMRAAQRLLALNVGTANGMDRYGYLGPIIPTSRIFCRHMVGYFYTLEMLDACDNGQIADVAVNGGGYECNHYPTPATEGMVRRTFPGKLVIGWDTAEAMDGKNPITYVVVTEAA